MSERQEVVTRRRFSAEEKSKIVMRIVQDGNRLSDVADELKIQPSQLVQWKKQLFENAHLAFESCRDSELEKTRRRLEDSERKIAEIESKRDQIIALVATEMCELKKKLSATSSPRGNGSSRM